MRMRRGFGRYVAVILSICIFISLFSVTTLSVKAQEAEIPLQVYVKETGEHLFIGDLKVENGELYISVGTLSELNGSENAAVDGDYVPFAETLYKMGYTAEFAEEERLLWIGKKRDLSEVQNLLEAIYDNVGYNMFYWQNSDWYEKDVEVALAADCIKNFTYISYMSGRETQVQYENAFWKIILPEEDKDLEVLTGVEESGKTAKEVYDIGENLVKLVGQVAELKGITGLENFSKFSIKTGGDDLDICAATYGKVVGLAQLDDIKELLVFTDVIDSTMQATVRGIDVLLENGGIIDEKMKTSGKNVIELYQGDASVTEELLKALVEGNGVDLATEAYNGIVFGAPKVLAEIVNKIADARLNTQAQVTATIEAARCLSIQKACGDYYKVLKKQLKNADWAEYDVILRDMHDITVVYLQAGAEAQRAVAIDEELTAGSKRIIKSIDADLTLLAEYHGEEFAAVERLREAENLLLAYAEHLADTPEALQLDSLEALGTMTITWNGEGYDSFTGESNPYDLNVLLEGSFPEGDILQSKQEGMYFDANDKLAALITGADKQITIEFFDIAAYYTITVENSFPDNGWTSTDYTRITYDAPDVTDFDQYNYLNRGMTGFWYYSIILENGAPSYAY